VIRRDNTNGRQTLAEGSNSSILGLSGHVDREPELVSCGYVVGVEAHVKLVVSVGEPTFALVCPDKLTQQGAVNLTVAIMWDVTRLIVAP
jgi:hypothetical protein